MIIRERYLKNIRPFYDQDLIKVLIGIRRSGKSVLLTQIMDELKNSNIDDNHIIYMNFEDLNNEEYTDYKKLNKYIKEKIKDKNKYYIFFDEIQNVVSWEKVVNSLEHRKTLHYSLLDLIAIYYQVILPLILLVDMLVLKSPHLHLKKYVNF